LLNGSAPVEPIAGADRDDLELLSFRDVAKLLHCHRDRVADLVATGALKSVPVGRGLRRVPRWALREYQLSLVGAR
jgi:excisionase family DNA binding protein